MPNQKRHTYLQTTNLGFKTAQIGATPVTELHESVQNN